MQKFSLHYHSFVLIMALYHSVRKIILCWLAAAVTEITTQQYYFQHFRNMLHECPCPSAFLDFVKQAAFSCSQNHATTAILCFTVKIRSPIQWYFHFAVWIKPTFSHYLLFLRPNWLFNTKTPAWMSSTVLPKQLLHKYLC